MARLSRFAVAAITAIAVSLLLTYGTYAIRLLAGGPLTRRYIVWSSFLLPIFLGLFAAVWPAPNLKRSALAAGSAGASDWPYVYLCRYTIAVLGSFQTLGGLRTFHLGFP